MSNKKYVLPIYGEDDEIVKEYATDVVRYGILEDALKASEEVAGKGATEQLKVINPIIKRVFKGLTDEELKDADLFDVFNVFNQIIALSKSLNGNSKSEKN